MHIVSVLSISFKLLLLFYEFSYASDTISSSDFISDGGRTLVSKNGIFEFGFFSPGSSKNRYVGIWYKNIPVRTVVWVGNRVNPINDSFGMLMINSTGYLVLMTQNKNVVWSANSTRKEAKGSVLLQLLNSGNLVLRDEQLGSYLWQSFDYPSDTLLPEMKIGWDLKTGLERRLTAWKSWDDPSPGDFTWGVPLQDFPEAYMWKGSNKVYRSGPWNGLRFSSPVPRTTLISVIIVSNENELSYIFNLNDKSEISRVVINQTRYVRERFSWNEATQSWTLYSHVPRDYCDNYGICGAYGNCITTQSPICQCLEGFKPKSTGYKDWSQGCVRNKPLNYSKLDGFIKFDRLKWPDATHSRVNASMNLRQCREKCLENSSCMAYANSDVREGGRGCAMWFGDLMDIRQYSEGGDELFIRMSASELGTKDGPKMEIVVIVVTATAMVVGVLILGCYIYKSRANLGKTLQKIEDLELPLFEFVTIARATNHFSFHNKLGEGGYGPVYKGTLENGQEIAVKRLSNISGQGLKEFKNEVILIAKLQHRNLVKLLGCCIQGEEKILIYEFMPNKNQTRSKVLDWSKRFQIICGIARGLLYLHQDSRLRIIHRDLKASNVLLDHELNPKISDFGLARIFNGDQATENTNRVVGTYGYMAPEYAINGIFSTKSDVFSFGILLLELVSGKKSRGFCHPDHNLGLIGYAWKLWKEDKLLELIDPTVIESCNASEAIRSIHISLLCMEHQSDDRPTMSSVVLMLGCEIALPQPKQPGFLVDSRMPELDSSNKPEFSSSNEITISMLEAR